MKKTVFFSALITGLFAMNANAQLTDSQVTLNVRLTPIQTIVVNAGQKTVDLNYDSKNAYEDGVTVSKADHLNIYSTGGFAVKVSATSAELTSGATAKTIAANTIKISASEGSTNPLTAAKGTTVSLTNNPQDLITSATGGFNKNFNVDYAGAGLGAYVNNFVASAGNPEVVYTTTVQYEIIAQ